MLFTYSCGTGELCLTMLDKGSDFCGLLISGFCFFSFCFLVFFFLDKEECLTL